MTIASTATDVIKSQWKLGSLTGCNGAEYSIYLSLVAALLPMQGNWFHQMHKLGFQTQISTALYNRDMILYQITHYIQGAILNMHFLLLFL